MLLVVPSAEHLKSLDVVDFVEGVAERVHDVDTERLDVLDLDELEQLENGRVEQVVAAVVAQERVDHRLQEVALHDVSVVEFVCS